MDNRIAAITKLVDRRRAELDLRRRDLESLRTRLEETQEALEVKKKAGAVLVSLSDEVYAGSVEAFRTALNFGIAAAYPRGVSTTLAQDVKRGRPQVELGIDIGKGSVDLRSAQGGGLASILGLLARVVVIRTTGKRRLLVLDEPFSAVSVDLQPKLSALIRTLVEKLGFQVILVTHTPRLAESADLTYTLTGPGIIGEEES